MAILPIDSLALYLKKSGLHNENKDFSRYQLVALIDSKNNILAAIKFIYSDTAWHVENVVAKDGYGPTIYQLLMQIAGPNGLAPCYKARSNSKEFIVSKSKKIWCIFYKSSSIRPIKIEEKYSDDYLNYKYVLKKDVFDLPKAFRRLDRLNIKRYLHNLGRWDRLKTSLLKQIDDEKLDEFEQSYIDQLESKVVAFLSASVEAHA